MSTAVKPGLILFAMLLASLFCMISYAPCAYAKTSDFVVVDGVATRYLGNSTTVNIPSSVKKVGAYFSEHGGDTWTTVSIPSSVTEIGEKAFEGCSKLSKLTFSGKSKLKTVESQAFADCTELETVVLPDTVSYIGSGSFSGCSSLREVVLPAGIIALDTHTFSGCTMLQAIHFPDGLRRMPQYLSSDHEGFDESGSGTGKVLPAPSEVPELVCYARDNYYLELWTARYGYKFSSLRSASSAFYGYEFPCSPNVTSLKLPPVNVLRGSTDSLSVLGNLPASWRSSNSRVATVDNTGDVTGKRLGTAVITATLSGSVYSRKVNVLDEGNLEPGDVVELAKARYGVIGPRPATGSPAVDERYMRLASYSKCTATSKVATVPRTVQYGAEDVSEDRVCVLLVSSISPKAFKGTNVKTVTVKVSGLTKADVRDCLKGSKIKTVKVKVGDSATNAKWAAKYKKIFTKANCGRAVKMS